MRVQLGHINTVKISSQGMLTKRPNIQKNQRQKNMKKKYFGLKTYAFLTDKIYILYYNDLKLNLICNIINKVYINY